MDSEFSVNLTDIEVKLATCVAIERNKANRSQGVFDGVEKEKSLEVDILGMKGEIGLCKMFGLYPDLDVGHRPFHDLILPSGATVDVKATVYKTGHLSVNPRKKHRRSDIYALVIVDKNNVVSFAGWLPYEEVISADVHPEYKTHWISQEKLFAPNKLDVFE